MMKHTSIVLTLLCTSLVWCSALHAMEGDPNPFVLDTRPGQKLVLTEQGHAKALALQTYYDDQQKKKEDILKESLKPSTNDEDSELASILGLSLEDLKLSKALHSSFEKPLDPAHLAPETNPQPSDIPYPSLKEKKDNGLELKPSLLNYVPEINKAKEREKITELTELVSQISAANEEAWKVYLSLISPDPETEALEDDEEKTRRRKAREEEKEKASENWGRLFKLHAETEAALKELKTKEALIGKQHLALHENLEFSKKSDLSYPASIEEDEDPDLKLALLSSTLQYEAEQKKIANEIREAEEKKEAEERRQAQKRRDEAVKMLESVREIRRTEKESIFSRIRELGTQKLTLIHQPSDSVNDFIPITDNESYQKWRKEKIDTLDNKISSLKSKLAAFKSVDDHIHEEMLHLLQGGDPRDLPWKQEVLRKYQIGASSLPTNSHDSLTPHPTMGSGKGFDQNIHTSK